MTITSSIKKMILQCLADGTAHDIDFIKKFLREKQRMEYEIDYTKGHLSGALYYLVKTEKIENPERGLYRISKGSMREEGEKGDHKTKEMVSNLEERSREEIIRNNECHPVVEKRYEFEAIRSTVPMVSEDFGSYLKKQQYTGEFSQYKKVMLDKVKKTQNFLMGYLEDMKLIDIPSQDLECAKDLLELGMGMTRFCEKYGI